MPEAMIMSILLSLVATLFGLLVIMLGWMGNKVYNRLGDIVRSLHDVETDLRGQLTDLDRRVLRVETLFSGIKHE